MVAVALPDIVDDYDAPLAWAGWVVTAYLLSQAISMPISGKLSDEIGRKQVFIVGAILFGIASMACALAPNIYVLIAARAGQGLAGGSMLPSTYGLVGDAFLGRAERPLGLVSASFPLGSIVAPTLGGVIVEQLGWRWTFVFNAAPNVLIVLAAIALLPSSSPRANRSPIDFKGAAWLSAIIGSTIFGLTKLANDNPQYILVVASFVLAAACVPPFLRQESKAADPMLDLKLLRKGPLAVMNVLHFCYGIGLLGAFFFIPLYARTAYSAGSSASGLLLAPRSIVMMLSSILAAMILPMTGYRKPIVFGLLVLAGALAGLSLGLHDVNVAGVEVPDFLYLIVLVAIGGLGIGLAGPAANNAALGTVPEQIATVIGVRGMFRFVGGVFGTTLIVLITSQADTTAEGLERAFLVVAVITALTVLFVIPLSGLRRPMELPVTQSPDRQTGLEQKAASDMQTGATGYRDGGSHA
jgi:EmrB/QacA subfamily drug resistance transporter